jgi:hypothetical protein
MTERQARCNSNNTSAAPLWPIFDLHAIDLQPNRMSSNEPLALVLLDPGDIHLGPVSFVAIEIHHA